MHLENNKTTKYKYKYTTHIWAHRKIFTHIQVYDVLTIEANPTGKLS